MFGRLVDECYREIIDRNNSVDYYCLGNPQKSIEYIIDNQMDLKVSFNNTHIANNLYYENKTKDLYFDKDLFPVYDYYGAEYYLPNINKFYPIMTKNQVCYCNCSFCWSEKGKFIYKDVEHIISEIKNLIRLKIYDFVFIDNDFFDLYNEYNKQRIIKILNEIILLNQKITFSIFAKSKSINRLDDDFINLLKQAGMHCVFLGIDAGNESDKKLYKKTSSLEEDFRAIQRLRKHGIFFRMGFIGINPYTTLQTMKNNYETLVQLRDSNFYHYMGLKMMLFPGTTIYSAAKKDGLIIENRGVDVYGYNFKNDEVKEYVRFFDETKRLIEGHEGLVPFIFLKRSYEKVKCIDHSIYDKYHKFMDEYEENEFNALALFFSKVFLDNDIGWAMENRNKFIAQLTERAKDNDYLIEEMERQYGICHK